MKVISFIDFDGNVVLKNKLTSLPLKEESIINKSVELFRDCDPCIIHRTFVMKKLFFEIDEYFDKMVSSGQNEISVGLIPENIFQVLDLKGQVKKVLIS